MRSVTVLFVALLFWDTRTTEALTCGETVTGSIRAVGEVDTYLLQGINPEDTVSLQMPRTSGSLTSYLELYDGSGTRIASGNWRLGLRLESAGPYTLLVRDYWN